MPCPVRLLADVDRVADPGESRARASGRALPLADPALGPRSAWSAPDRQAGAEVARVAVRSRGSSVGRYRAYQAYFFSCRPTSGWQESSRPVQALSRLADRHFCPHLKVRVEEIRLRAGPHCIKISAHEVSVGGCQGDVSNIEVAQTDGPQVINVRLGYTRSVLRNLFGIGQHRHLLLGEPGSPIIPVDRQSPLPAQGI